nr:protein bir1 [Quercus suber]
MGGWRREQGINGCVICCRWSCSGLTAMSPSAEPQCLCKSALLTGHNGLSFKAGGFRLDPFGICCLLAASSSRRQRRRRNYHDSVTLTCSTTNTMAPHADATIGKGTYAARLATFQRPHQLSKRRASSSGGGRKKKNDNVLAQAGFFYRPGQDSPDNVQCYFCEVKLDGWEPEDDAVQEHLSHAPHCAWATCVSALKKDGEEEESRDPMSEAMVTARAFTFSVGEGWIHENKRGWKCKINRMVDAGWVLDPGPDTEDGVTCMHCNLSLDGWEPKDDPADEHKRRSPDCQFFTLIERYHGSVDLKSKKVRVGGGSSTSKIDRQSAQSDISTFSEDPELADLSNLGVSAENDDSVMTTASTSTIKASKKKGRPAKASKSAKSKTATNAQDIVTVAYPDLDASQSSAGNDTRSEEQPAIPAVRPTRPTRQRSKHLDSPVVDGSVIQTDSKNKSAQPKLDRLKTPDNEREARFSDASAQLQEELEISLNMTEDSTPKRGVKRTSDGLRKDLPRDSNIATIQFPVPPQPVAKTKRGRKPKQSVAEEDVVVEHAAKLDPQQSAKFVTGICGDTQMPEPVSSQPLETVKVKNAAMKKGRAKKTSSTRSSKASVTARSPVANSTHYDAEDMARDELEIEAELQRIAVEQATAIQVEHELEAEFENSPSHAQRHADKIHELELELHNENLTVPDPSLNMANFIATVAENPLPPALDMDGGVASPSPSGSDKENKPAVVQTDVASPSENRLSSFNTLRIPLAPGTPNTSAAKQILRSPSKQISNLTSSVPWVPVDLETVLLASPQPTPNTLAQRLAGAAGMLQSPEKNLNVEGWIRYRAEQGEEQLRRKCEEIVGAFEREGMRALSTLNGIVTV